MSLNIPPVLITDAVARAIARTSGGQPQGEHEIDIDPNGDLIIQLYTGMYAGPVHVGASGDGIPGRPVAAFKVSRKTLIANSRRFKTLLIAALVQKNPKAVDIPCETIGSFELMFRILHGTMTEEMSALGINEFWEALKLCEDWEIVNFNLDDWYKTWNVRRYLKTCNMDELRQLLYPLREFNDPESFAYATKTLVYEYPKSITEMNPTKHREMQLEPRVIESLNDARNVLKSRIIQTMFDPIENAVNLTCRCKAACLASWCEALCKCGIWPPADLDNRSVLEIMEHPGTMDFQCTLPKNACKACKDNFNSSNVHALQNGQLDAFEGMCLDCMARSNTGQGRTRKKFWLHDEQKKWDKGCRIKHGETTWFFSFVGDKKDMENYQELKSMKERIAQQMRRGN